MAGRVLRTYPGKGDALILDVGGSAELGLATVADLAGFPPGSVTDGENLADAADRIVAEQQDRVAIAAIKAQQIELFRRSDLHWIGWASTWILPAGSDLVMAVVPASADDWNVWRLPKGSTPVLESGHSMPLDWAQGVAEEVARARGGVLSAADAGWRSARPTDPQTRLIESLGYAAAGLDRGRRRRPDHRPLRL